MKICQRLSFLRSFQELKTKRPIDTKLKKNEIPVFGITGTGGAGKSSLIDELLLRFNRFDPNFKIALISVDPTRKKSKVLYLEIEFGSVQHHVNSSLSEVWQQEIQKMNLVLKSPLSLIF